MLDTLKKNIEDHNSYKDLVLYNVILVAACLGLRASEYVKLKWSELVKFEQKVKKGTIDCYRITFEQSKGKTDQKVFRDVVIP